MRSSRSLMTSTFDANNASFGPHMTILHTERHMEISVGVLRSTQYMGQQRAHHSNALRVRQSSGGKQDFHELVQGRHVYHTHEIIRIDLCNAPKHDGVSMTSGQYGHCHRAYVSPCRRLPPCTPSLEMGGSHSASPSQSQTTKENVIARAARASGFTNYSVLAERLHR